MVDDQFAIFDAKWFSSYFLGRGSPVNPPPAQPAVHGHETCGRQPMQQTWTALRRDGPDRLGLCSKHGLPYVVVALIASDCGLIRLAGRQDDVPAARLGCPAAGTLQTNSCRHPRAAHSCMFVWRVRHRQSVC